MRVNVEESIASGRLQTYYNFDRFLTRAFRFLVPLGLSVFLMVEFAAVYRDHEVTAELTVLFFLAVSVTAAVLAIRSFSKEPELSNILTRGTREETIKISLKVAESLHWTLQHRSSDHLVFISTVSSSSWRTNSALITTVILFDCQRILIASTEDFRSSYGQSTDDFIRDFAKEAGYRNDF